MSPKLPSHFYERDAVTVARDLLGQYLCRPVDGVLRIGKIVETEAYLGPHDLAAHSSKGLTARTSVLFGPPGHAYIYLIYGIYCCLNVVTDQEGSGSAVLLRALEPVANIAARTQGPGLLCKALAIDRSLNSCDLQGDELFLAPPPKAEAFSIVEAPRVGVDYAGPWAERLLRFYVRGNRFVSRK
ncbi:DNA-3-methyladenine glycosylase [Geomonas sp. RF6]|uniref:DNA-3-methyladenine glycosylase n=1 Tax=Geomonas sp. RF6 TaxID=2897342 RepID=UPI001E316FC6|nr:DNA-3-methyladenine glycosylase [Geomonas sp. RF6]UFS70028.1 DNA-3-methyladenine glycosylase [Geomonas sp. RF6]